MLEFRPLRASDLLQLEPQPSQSHWLGVPVGELSLEEAQAHADSGNAWTVWRDGAPIACLGVLETFPDRQGTAWALLGTKLGRDHLALTRFARDVVIGASPLVRIETFAACCPSPIETADSPRWLLGNALARPTPEIRWAIRVGFSPVAVLRKFGAASETVMLLEVVR